MMVKVGIVGHRNLKSECISRYRQQIRELLISLKEEYQSVLLYSALAEGADRLVVDVGRELGMEYIAVLPMKIESYRLDFTDDMASEFDRYLTDASITIEMPWFSTSDRDMQYEAAGHCIADRCEVLIALWDGKQSYLRGGTSETVNYFVQKENAIFYHIPVSRE